MTARFGVIRGTARLRARLCQSQAQRAPREGVVPAKALYHTIGDPAGTRPFGRMIKEMSDAYVYVRDLRQQAKVPENGILSQTLRNDDRAKVILFGFAPGQELSAHTAPFPATLTFLKGDALLKLGSEEQLAGEGTFVYMRPNLEQGNKAQSVVVMLLTMIKSTPPTPA